MSGRRGSGRGGGGGGGGSGRGVPRESSVSAAALQDHWARQLRLGGKRPSERQPGRPRSSLQLTLAQRFGLVERPPPPLVRAAACNKSLHGLSCLSCAACLDLCQ